LQAYFRRAQLKALVGLHSTDEGLGGTLSADEISIITGALDLTSKTAWAAMTPLDKVRGHCKMKISWFLHVPGFFMRVTSCVCVVCRDDELAIAGAFWAAGCFVRDMQVAVV
jgi:hypothetical protein